ncbi:MAG: hypothetical protein HQ582_24170 [Planctomycetes bacterium]|nr:hypothetical protein [Planctomycetota bacterium]
MSKQLFPYAALLALFLVSFLAFNWGYGYVIAFQSQTNDCFFVFGRPFLLEFLDRPAGPLRYAGRFLGQFYHYQWLGALIVSAGITCFGFLFHRVLVKLDRSVSAAQMLLPCVLLVALHVSTLWLVYDTLGLCASCAAFWGYLSWRGKSARRVYALAVTPIAYLLLGAYAWFFVVWVIAFEWLGGPLRSGLLFKIVYVVFSMAVPLAAWRWVFLTSLRGALTCPLLMNPPFRTGSAAMTNAYFVVDCCLAVALCVLLLVIPFWRRLFAGMRLGTFWRVKPDRTSRVALAVATGVLAILFHLVRYDAPLATVVACHRLYNERQWDALLDKARDNPFKDVRLQFMTNFALYHKGTLLEEMFSYPQPWGSRGLVFNFVGRPGLTRAEDDTGKSMYNSDLFYEMGHANAALRHAYNNMCLRGTTYDNMRRMAQSSALNGNHEMAAKYLNLLEQTLFHKRFARRYKAILADPEAAEREFGDLKKRLPDVDGYMFEDPTVPFVTLLAKRSDNRMAFDYLAAWLLLDRGEDSIATIATNIDLFRTVGYPSMPTHCQEAIFLKERAERIRVDLRGFRYDTAAVTRANEFLQDASPYFASREAPEQIRTQYGNTYLFYYFFVAAPRQPRRLQDAGGGFGGTTRVE